ncbi:MAG TPA: hypothetical protein VJ570_11460 [Holophagaceae bacterium]|nr:hypothetical protein [Holophagaceae bacterium]
MTDIPKSLEAYLPNVGRTCVSCGRRVVEAVVDDAPFLCATCEGAPQEGEIIEDDLTLAALDDPTPREAPVADRPTAWRTVVLILVAVGALALVLGRR